MSKCRDIKEQFQAYFEEDIPPEKKRLVEEHLAICKECRTELQDLKDTATLLRDLEEIEPPPWLKQKVMARIREEAEEKKGIFQWLFYPLHVKVPVEIFATCLVVVMALYVFKATGPEMKAIQRPSVPVETLSKAAIEQKYEKTVSAASTPENKKLLRKEDEKDVVRPSPVQKGGAAVSAPVVVLPPPTRPSEKITRESATDTYKQDMELTAPSQPAQKTASISAATPVPSLKDKEGFAAAGAGILERQERKAKQVAPQLKMAVPKQPQIITISIKTESITSAARDAQNILSEAGAINIRRESLENMEALTAELQTQKVKELMDKLSSVWDIKEKIPSSDVKGSDAIAIIEIKLIGKK